jgi:hypothetical protein
VVVRRLMPTIVLLTMAAVIAPARAGVAADAVAPGSQGRQGQQPAAATGDGARPITPGEVRKMFDSYALMQAQEQLKISNEQFPKFLMQFKALQELRRTATQERNKILQELRQGAADTKVNDAQLKDHLKALRDIEEKSHGDMRKAYDEIDKVLDVRQQARFRVFEQQMEQRMLQLVSRARQANRPKAVK